MGSVTLMCPAQAYPVPFFRVVHTHPILQAGSRIFQFIYFGTYFQEPVGSVGPKLTSGDDSRTVKVKIEASVTLLCPAQAYPVPVYR